MKTYFPRVLGASIAGLSLMAPTLAASQNLCTPYSGTGHTGKNVILIVLDDVSIEDLPMFNPPVAWQNNEAVGGVTNDASTLREAAYVGPDLNRFVARSLATPDGYLGTRKSGAAGAGNPTVKPVDIPSTELPTGTSATTFKYRKDAAATDPQHHVLSGFGGLGELARKGATMRRFYGVSSVCSPARAAILTGRHPQEVGVPTLGHQLQVDEVTIATFLRKSGITPAYRTAMFGKWGIGQDGDSSPINFFDEVLGAWGDYRPHFESATMRCFPAFQYLGPDSLTPCSSSGTIANTDPLCCSNAANYEFSKKRKTGANLDYWQGRDSTVCKATTNPDILPKRSVFEGSTGPANACRYDTRFLGEAVKNFIIRTSRTTPTYPTAAPFFIYFAPHAAHYPNDAPEKTVKHYATGRCSNDAAKVCSADNQCVSPGKCNIQYPDSPGGNQNPREFWAVLEEFDAALGKILQTIEGFCTDSDNVGKTCAETQNTCACNTDLAKKTLVMLTSDNAHAGSNANPGFGSPWFRGNKLTLEEGGMRLGLSVWFGADTFAIGESSANADVNALDSVVGSHVDIFPTIAHAAGCKPDTNGQYSLNLCAGTRNFQTCTQDSNCASGVCLNRTLAGRSLLPLLSARVAGYNEDNSGQTAGPIKPRRFAFAERSEALPAIVSAAYEGTDPNDFRKAKVCGAKPNVALNTSETLYPMRQAGSSFRCDRSTDAACSTRVCQSNGKFCMLTSQAQGVCRTSGSGCDWEKQRRCVSTADCPLPAAESCTAVKIPCNECPVASWKLRGDASTEMSAKELYDLTTNPEELPELNLLSNADLNSVRTPLLSSLKGWYRCIKGGAGEDGLQKCEEKTFP